MENIKMDKNTLNSLLFLAEAFDGYTTGRNVDLKKVKIKIDEAKDIIKHKIDKTEQRRIFEVADYIINLPVKDSNAHFYAKIFLITKLLLRVFIFIFMFLILYIFSFGYLDLNILVILGWSTVVIIFFRWFSLTKVLEFYERELKSHKSKTKFLKDMTQRIIYLISENKEKWGLKSKNIKLHLYNKDYERIRVIKRPSLLREYYLVEVD
ncbi:MAG: hypothetical protein H5T50_02900 [Nitrososphaeria archaeon]|nr:hypothetical protein [Nitrososphaeria archaeon]